MSRSTVRLFAFVVLALLGAPVAMHVVLHDLHGHEGETTTAGVGAAEHGPHEHPVISSAAPEAVPPDGCFSAMSSTAVPATSCHTERAERNVIAHGALRTDDDVGLQSLLSTFLI